MAETGHAKNVAHFETMISFVTGYGGVYKPSNASIEPGQLQSKAAVCQGGIDGVTSALAPWKVNVNERESEFEGFRKLGDSPQYKQLGVLEFKKIRP